MKRLFEKQAIANLSTRIGLPISTKGFKKEVLRYVVERDALIHPSEVDAFLKDEESDLGSLLSKVVPDGFFIAPASCTVVVFEIEDTSKLTEEKAGLYHAIGWALDQFEWEIFVVISDRYGLSWNYLHAVRDLFCFGPTGAADSTSEEHRDRMEAFLEEMEYRIPDSQFTVAGPLIPVSDEDE